MVKSFMPCPPPSSCCQVELERLRREEEAALAGREKEQLGQMVQSLEQELSEQQAEVQTLQVRGHRCFGNSMRRLPTSGCKKPHPKLCCASLRIITVF